MKYLVMMSFILCFKPHFCEAQEWHAKFGLVLDFGNAVKRIGVRFDVGGRYTFVQANAKVGLYYNFSSWGVESKTPEMILGIGSHFGAGKKQIDVNPYISLHDRNLTHNVTLGYVYQYYFDWQGTTQSTGMIVGSYKGFTLITENDLLGGGKGWRDRFRTGGLKVSFRHQQIRFGINLQLYTGDYASCSKVVNDSSFPARFGYRAQDKVVHGTSSLGILSFQTEYVGLYSQSARLDFGLNSEKIRNAVQNKGLHDMPFYTDKMVKRKLMHIPMLQSDGTSYLFKDGQAVRPGTFYYNLSVNPASFY